ncbi:MAG: cation transporter [Desulfovibrio sp.]|nr:cation transporter [Desulfovibrio sp.]
MTKTLLVKGMMCGHCEAHVQKALLELAGVSQAVADHNSGTVQVTLEADVAEAALAEAVTKAGYEFQGLQ